MKNPVQLVQQKLSECNGCKNNCPCLVLSKYMNEVGIEEFERQLNNGTLPDNIKAIYLSKKNQLNV